MQITEVTSRVTGSVDNLASSSNSLLSYVSSDVANDYKVMLDIADKYSQDARFVDTLGTEFSATSEELLASIHNMLLAIDGVAKAANEGATGTTDIANRAVEVNEKSSNVKDVVSKTRESANKLKAEIERFKI
jgi:methyl-accepting chemotaxis protein